MIKHKYHSYDCMKKNSKYIRKNIRESGAPANYHRLELAETRLVSLRVCRRIVIH